MPFEFREERLTSNPVAILQATCRGAHAERRVARELLARDVELPAHYLAHLGFDPGAGRTRHGVVGCVVEESGLGWVDRLLARPSRKWQSRKGLPFDALELDAILLALLRVRGEELVHLLPEARCFELTDQLVAAIEGESMTIAAVLAVLDGASGGVRPEFQAALSLVQLERPGSERLVPVEAAAAKLEAFARECGRGSLCLVAPGDAADAVAQARARSAFDVVWVVGDLAALGARLEERGLLDAVAEVEVLDRRVLSSIEALIARMARQDWLVARGLDLARRLQAAAASIGFARDVPFAQQRAASRHLFALLRYEAALAEVVEAPAAAYAALDEDLPDLSHDERARAAVDLASAYFVAYRFDEMADLLAGWRARVQADPGAFTSSTRVRVTGSLGRALAVRAGTEAGPLGWRACFSESIELVERSEPGALSLSRGFFVGALLAADHLDEAEGELARAEAELLQPDYRDNVSRWFLAFDRADLARRRGRVWSDPEMETPDVLRAGQYGRPLGYYFQATARQAGREPADAAARFERAAEAFGTGPPPADSGQWWFTHLMRLGAAERRGDAAGWQAAHTALVEFLSQPFARWIAAWFDELPGRLGAELAPGAGARLEALLARDPYLLGRKGGFEGPGASQKRLP